MCFIWKRPHTALGNELDQSEPKSFRIRHTQHRRCAGPTYREPASLLDVLPADDSIYTPKTPVRVHLLHDEEAVLDRDESEHRESAEHPPLEPLLTPPPPAYGLWRCSVRADPNLLRWERRNITQEELEAGCEMVEVAHVRGRRERRPPSYVNEAPDEEDLLDLGLRTPCPHQVQNEVLADTWVSRRQSVAVAEVARMMRVEAQYY